MFRFPQSGRSRFLDNVVIFADGSVTWTADCVNSETAETTTPQPNAARSLSFTDIQSKTITITTTIHVSAT